MGSEAVGRVFLARALRDGTEQRLVGNSDIGRPLTLSMIRRAFTVEVVVGAVADVIAAGDKVVLRWHSEGTHRGELAGLAPTGARGSVTGISIDQWKDGKEVETWTESDHLGLARQLGAAPPEGSFGEKLGIGE